MYPNISNRKMRNAVVIGYLFFVVFVPVFYYLTGINDTKSIIAYVIGIVIFPGIITLASWLQYRHDPSVTASRVIKNLKADQTAIREKVVILSQKKKWRLVEQGENRLKLETPFRLPSFGEYITIEMSENEVTILSIPKVSPGQDTVITGSDHVEAISKVLEAG
jgi:hypothetical protein